MYCQKLIKQKSNKTDILFICRAKKVKKCTLLMLVMYLFILINPLMLKIIRWALTGF